MSLGIELGQKDTNWKHISGLQVRSNNKENRGGFPGGSVVNNPPGNAGDMGLILDLGKSHMPQSI